MPSSHALIGTWKLKQHSGYVGEPAGRLLYHPNMTMAVVIHGQIQKDGALVEHTLAYSGPFHCDGSFVVHVPEVSDNPARTGVPQRRFVTLRENLLILSEGEDQSRGFVIQWERQA